MYCGRKICYSNSVIVVFMDVLMSRVFKMILWICLFAEQYIELVSGCVATITASSMELDLDTTVFTSVVFIILLRI